MGQSTVQHTQTQSLTTVSSLSKAFASNNAANNLLVYSGLWDNASPNPTASDTRNTVSTRVGPTNAAGATQATYNVDNCGSGANTAQLSWGSPNPSFCGLYIHEFTDSASHTNGFTFDKKAEANGVSANPASGNTATTTQAVEVVFGFSNSSGNVPTAGAGFTILEQDSTLNGIGTEVQFVTSTGAQNAVFTEASSTWDAQCSTYFTASVGGATSRIEFPQSYGVGSGGVFSNDRLAYAADI